jgi:hypothetical protein
MSVQPAQAPVHVANVAYALVPQTETFAEQNMSQLPVPQTPAPSGPALGQSDGSRSAARAARSRHPIVLPLVSAVVPVVQPNARHASIHAIDEPYCAFDPVQLAMTREQ